MARYGRERERGNESEEDTGNYLCRTVSSFGMKFSKGKRNLFASIALDESNSGTTMVMKREGGKKIGTRNVNINIM